MTYVWECLARIGLKLHLVSEELGSRLRILGVTSLPPCVIGTTRDGDNGIIRALRRDCQVVGHGVRL